MKIEPVLTEKSLEEAKKGNYTFYVDKSVNKYQAKELIGKIFDVHVVKVNSLNLKRENKRTYSGRVKVIKPKKKVIVTLREKEKIDIFETKKK